MLIIECGNIFQRNMYIGNVHLSRLGNGCIPEYRIKHWKVSPDSTGPMRASFDPFLQLENITISIGAVTSDVPGNAVEDLLVVTQAFLLIEAVAQFFLNGWTRLRKQGLARA
jgi:hypothetical protein